MGWWGWEETYGIESEKSGELRRLLLAVSIIYSQFIRRTVLLIVSNSPFYFTVTKANMTRDKQRGTY